MEYTIVKQVIGELDIMPCKDLETMRSTINAICVEMCDEGIAYEAVKVHQDRWGGRLLYEVHAEDGCIYSVFRNETNE